MHAGLQGRLNSALRLLLPMQPGKEKEGKQSLLLHLHLVHMKRFHSVRLSCASLQHPFIMIFC